MKIGFLITARLKSSRLPLKLLLDLNGRTVIERIIDRAKTVHDISEVVLCTSTNPQDKPLVDIARSNGVYYYNGDEEDVLKRLFDAAIFFNLDYIISITADNPLFSIYHANLIVDTIKRTKCDFVKITGLPLGAATSGLKVKALKLVCEVKKIIDTEIWGPLIDRPDLFAIEHIVVDGFFNKPDLRLTLDYEEDYELLKNIYYELNESPVVDLHDAIYYLNINPDINNINMNCVQRELDEETLNNINETFLNKRDDIAKLKQSIYRE